MPKITVAIPAYNQNDTIKETIISALKQICTDKEILIVDDASTDDTVEIIKQFEGVRLIRNKKNQGIGKTLVKLMNKAKGEYIVYLCGDDYFTSSFVCADICAVFDDRLDIDLIHRNYYQFIDGTNRICGLIDENNLYQSSCQPSGMAFRIMEDLKLKPCNDIFIEMPSIVDQYKYKLDWFMYRMPYPTIMARIHKNNTAVKSSYYGNQSPTRNWVSLVGDSFRFPEGLIQLKNRAPHLLFKEIKIISELTPKALHDWKFWFCAFVAIVTPRIILINLCWWWRKYISTTLYAWRKK